MSLQAVHRIDSRLAEDEAAVRALYEELMAGWNTASGEPFALPLLKMGTSSPSTAPTLRAGATSRRFINRCSTNGSRVRAWLEG